jgi:hypothetical protein
MLLYASILEKPRYDVHKGVRYLLPRGEIINAAIAALRHCAALPPADHAPSEKTEASQS